MLLSSLQQINPFTPEAKSLGLKRMKTLTATHMGGMSDHLAPAPHHVFMDTDENRGLSGSNVQFPIFSNYQAIEPFRLST